jgi:hypothetical protein
MEARDLAVTTSHVDSRPNTRVWLNSQRLPLSKPSSAINSGYSSCDFFMKHLLNFDVK